MLKLLSPFKYYLISAAVIAALSGYLYVKHLRHEAAKARPAIATAKALDRVAVQTQANQEKADDAVKSVQAAPGADAPVPPDVLAAWRHGVDGLRQRSHSR